MFLDWTKRNDEPELLLSILLLTNLDPATAGLTTPIGAAPSHNRATPSRHGHRSDRRSPGIDTT